MKMQKYVHITPELDEALETFAAGGIILVADDENRENEIDIIVAAQHITLEQMQVILRYGTGIVCIPMSTKEAQKRGLELMVKNNTDPHHTAFTVSVDGPECKTGVSAADRLHTIKAILNEVPLRSPGHMFPLIAAPELLDQRQGHTEAAVALTQMCGMLHEIAVIVELMKDDGEMMRVKDVQSHPELSKYPLVCVKDLKAYDVEATLPLSQIDEETEVKVKLPIQIGDSVYEGDFVVIRDQGELEHAAWFYPSFEEWIQSRDHVIRVHSECLTGNIFHSMRCDCKQQFDDALKYIVTYRKNENASGCVFYVTGHEGRGIGLTNKIHAYKKQLEERLDTYAANEAINLPVDCRDYESVAGFLRLHNIHSVSLITNNADKVERLTDLGIEVKQQICIQSKINEWNKEYLLVKANKNKAALTRSVPRALTQDTKNDEKHDEKHLKMSCDYSQKLKGFKTVWIVRAAWNKIYIDQLVANIRAEFPASVEVRK